MLFDIQRNEANGAVVPIARLAKINRPARYPRSCVPFFFLACGRDGGNRLKNLT